MSRKSKRLLQLSTEKGVSNWLTTLPIVDYGFELSKQKFRDSISLRYEWEISKLPTIIHVEANLIYNIVWVAKKGFITIRHNDLRDLTAKIISEVCYNTEVEPKLIPLRGEDLSYQTANRSNKTRLDVRARGFWERQWSSAMKEYCK